MALGQYLGASSAISKGIYHLNGDALDSSGNGNNGTATNVTWVGGRTGSGSASFNGSNSEITFGNNGMFASTSLSIFLWVFFNSLSSVKYIFISQSGHYELIYIRISSDRLMFITGTGSGYSDGASESYGIPITNFTTGVRYNIGFTQTGTAIRQYINGQEFNNYTSAGSFKTFTGAYRGGLSANAERFNGLIDEVIIENRAWAAQEIKKYYTMSKGRFLVN